MNIAWNQLESALSKPQNVWILWGKESMLVDSSMRALRGYYAGFDYVRYSVDARFDWSELSNVLQEPSLFATNRLIEIHLPEGKAGQKGSKVISTLLEYADETNILVFSVHPVAGNWLKKTAWATNIERVGWAVSHAEFSVIGRQKWIEEQFAQRGKRIQRDALMRLDFLCEGNLLALVQEIDSLSLLSTESVISEKMVYVQVADQAQFTVFALVEQVFKGSNKRALRSIRLLRDQGNDAIFVTAMLFREAQIVYAVLDNPQSKNIRELFQGMPMWPARIKQIQEYASRLSVERLQSFIAQLEIIDRQSKGLEYGDAWCHLEHAIVHL